MENNELIATILIGLLLIALGFSFSVKFFQAAIQGKLVYWSGFLPLTILSPLFTHQAARKDTLIKETTGLWVHLFIAPIFLVISVLLLAIGSDLVGLPGIDTLNLILSGGNPVAMRAITYDKKYNLRFPILIRAFYRISGSMNTTTVPIEKYKGQ